MRVLLFALAATCSVVSLTAQQRAISDSDLFAFRWVASPQISPDGRQAAYVLVTVNAKHDGYETSLWLVNTDGASPPRRVTAGPRDGAPRWSRDGTRIYFVSDRVRESYYYPPDNNFYSVPAAGGSASLDTVVDINGPVFGPAVAPDGKTVAFRGWVNPRAVRSYNQSDLFVSRDGRARNLTADYDFDMGTDVIGDQAPPRGGGGSSPAIWTADGKSVIVTTTEHGRSNLVRFDAQRGAREPVTTGEHHVRPGVLQHHSVQVSWGRLQGSDGRGGFRDPARVRGLDQAGRDGRIGRGAAHRLDRGPHAPLRGRRVAARCGRLAELLVHG